MADGQAVTAVETGKLAAALLKVQQTIKPVLKTLNNEGFKKKDGTYAKYADLSAVWDSCRKELGENGLAVAQTMTPAPVGFVCVQTRLLHTSGESLVSSCQLPVTKQDAQGYASAITYARRYGLSAMVGVVADEDDDGNAASASPEPRTQSGTRPQTVPASRPTAKPQAAPKSSPRPAQAVPGASTAVFGNFGRSKGQPVHGASKGDLEWYANACRRSIADPSKARFHAAETLLLAAIEAEQRRQAGGPPSDDADDGTDGPDEPPPPGDDDAPTF